MLSPIVPTPGAYTALTFTLSNLASSTTFLVGRQSSSFDLAGAFDAEISGNITSGTAPTANTQINLYLIAALNRVPAWPDTFGAADAGVTVSASGILATLYLLAVLPVLTNTSNVVRPLDQISVRSALGFVPRVPCVLFVSHNSGVALRNDASNNNSVSVSIVS